jgi:hypothetical protein
MTYEIKLATVCDDRSLTKQGSFEALLQNTNIKVPVVMTSPIGIKETGSEYYSYAGMFGSPASGTDILVKKIDDSEYWYFDGVPAIGVIIPQNKDGTTETLIDPKIGSLDSAGDAVDTYSHSKSPQKYGLISTQGNKLVLSDSRNKGDRELFAKLESKTGQRALFSPSTGISAFKNAEGDGTVLTSKDYKGEYGVRSIKTTVFGNLTNYTTNGQMTLKVGSAGRVFNIINEAIKNYNQAGVETDNDVGAVNVESFENDVTITVNSKGTGRRIFIDARNTDGLVSIRAGSGGIEMHTPGDINMNCGGKFKIKSAGDIDIKSDNNIHLNPNNDVTHEFAKTNKEIAEESV